jgi:hypothetical protein
MEPMIGLISDTAGDATYVNVTLSLEVVVIPFSTTDTATSPAMCAGVRHLISLELMNTAGTESVPKIHSSSLVTENPEPKTLTSVFPGAVPNVGCTDMISEGVMYVKTT